MNPKALGILLVIALATTVFAYEPKELQVARVRYNHASHHFTEKNREHYVVRLADLRDRFAEAKRIKDWQAVDAEIRRHPAPKDSDSKALSKILVGKWASPRHEYMFRSDGTWSMLPAEPET